ncbi:hypothetical protein CLU96_1282 [Chryseobacterium sp. 52]|uniref:hypothetical protein n=1 Tax=Chryseobacterium sp. 52 TaxID=2035213 RepID=UPI000C632CB2|nr:hypothetical protein [Chryseobacterium sp. 52]PIF44338.1 hypothetical protein CLU96_1282 [Chryseobacterium sp. 52]
MNKIENTVKTPMERKDSYASKVENEYLEGLKNLLKDKRRGDWKLVGDMLRISEVSARLAFSRVYQKNHFEVVKALKKVIANRNKLIKQEP